MGAKTFALFFHALHLIRPGQRHAIAMLYRTTAVRKIIH
ncbi:hypothetical protein M621_02510 [Serratia plymuthica S13]|uniref:Uncharacterized protein n=1 Tax=Serratia plymuthica S13 TaxID=1348660 RepID=S4YN90_SERPL|nr:hypothetical protein M621_02510 [Serratia plymuthica S13]